jgi:hypothetical protein
MDTDKNLGGKAVPSEVESASDWWPVFAALKYLRICVHLWFCEGSTASFWLKTGLFHILPSNARRSGKAATFKFPERIP